MDDNHLLNPLVGRSLLPPATAFHYLLNMVLIHVFFAQYCQERPMDINICYFFYALPCIRPSMDTMPLSTWLLPIPYNGLTLTGICLFLPHLWSDCNTMPPSSLWHLVQFLECILFECNALLPGSLQHLA